MSDSRDDQYLAEACSNGEKISVRRHRIDRQGYDKDGRYFGTGAPLFRAVSDDMGQEAFQRAPDNKTAKDRIVSRLERVSTSPLVSKIKGCFRK